MPAPLGDDPRIDLIDASLLVSRDLPKARVAAQRAIAKATAQHAMLMVARGSGILCQADSSFGATADQFVSDCSLARNSYISAGDQNNAARTLNDFAGLYFNRGDITKAQTMWQEAIKVFRDVGDTEGLAASSNNLGDVLLTGGRLAQASKVLNQAILSYKLVGDTSGIALVSADLGEIALQRANLPEARKDYEQAVAAGLHADDKSTTASGIAGLGDVLLQQDQLAAARGQYEKALKLRTDIGEKQSILQTRVALARLAIEEGNTEDAEKEAARCLSDLHSRQFADDELDAGIVLVSAQLNQLKYPDAQREIDALRPLAEKTKSKVLHLRFELESAEVHLAAHDGKAPLPLLDSVAKDAEASGLIALAWEAQTISARARLEAGHNASAEKQLKMGEERERKADFLLLAHHAEHTTMLTIKPPR